MTDDYRPELADYFDSLEKKYGSDFSFEKITDDELEQLHKLANHAVNVDSKVTQVEKTNLKQLLTLIDIIQKKRRRIN